MKTLIEIICPRHNDEKKVVLLNDYANSLATRCGKREWFCPVCFLRLKRNYGDINFHLSEGFNTRTGGV